MSSSMQNERMSRPTYERNLIKHTTSANRNNNINNNSNNSNNTSSSSNNANFSTADTETNREKNNNAINSNKHLLRRPPDPDKLRPTNSVPACGRLIDENAEKKKSKTDLPAQDKSSNKEQAGIKKKLKDTRKFGRFPIDFFSRGSTSSLSKSNGSAVSPSKSPTTLHVHPTLQSSLSVPITSPSSAVVNPALFTACSTNLTESVTTNITTNITTNVVTNSTQVTTDSIEVPHVCKTSTAYCSTFSAHSATSCSTNSRIVGTLGAVTKTSNSTNARHISPITSTTNASQVHISGTWSSPTTSRLTLRPTDRHKPGRPKLSRQQIADMDEEFNNLINSLNEMDDVINQRSNKNDSNMIKDGKNSQNNILTRSSVEDHLDNKYALPNNSSFVSDNRTDSTSDVFSIIEYIDSCCSSIKTGSSKEDSKSTDSLIGSTSSSNINISCKSAIGDDATNTMKSNWSTSNSSDYDATISSDHDDRNDGAFEDEDDFFDDNNSPTMKDVSNDDAKVVSQSPRPTPPPLRHRSSTLDMFDIEKVRRNTIKSPTESVVTEVHGKTSVEFFPTQNTKASNKCGRFKSITVKLSEDTNKKFQIGSRSKRKTRREKLEDLKKKSMRQCGSDNMEQSDVYQSMLQQYDEVIEKKATVTEACTEELSSEEEHQCISRTISDFEREAFLRRDLVLDELLESEKNYVEDLGFIVDEYLPLMTEDHISDYLLYSYKEIFMNIADIHLFHVQTFQDQIIRCFEDPDLLDETFTTHEEQLTSLYTLYCGQKPTADESLKEYETELNELLSKNFSEIKLNMKDFLIKPVQRLMKYQLLLTSIKKYGVKAGRPATYLDAAIGAMERVPKEANDAMHVGLITDYDGEGCEVKKLLNHGQLEVTEGNRKPRTMHVFLFNTVCLFTEKASKLVPEYKCLHSDDTSGLGVTGGNNLSFVILFRKHNKTDIYKCEAPTMDDKEQWEVKIHQAMKYKDMQKRKKSVRRQLTIEISPTDILEATQMSSQQQFETLEIEEAVIKAMIGHPRLNQMTERLKSNIEHYIATEFVIPAMEEKSRQFGHKPITHRTSIPTQDSSNSLERNSDGALQRSAGEGGRRSVSPPRRKGKKSKKDREKTAARRMRSRSLLDFSSMSS